MASGLKSTRTQYRSVGATSLRPAFGASAGSTRAEWSVAGRNQTAAASETTRSNAVEGAQNESAGATSLRPAFGATSTGTTRTERSAARRNQTAGSEPARSNAVEGVKNAEKPLKKSPSDSGRKRKDKRHLRERRHGTGVVILPGGGQNDEQADEAKQTMDNTKMNESIGLEDCSPSPSEISTSSTPSRSSRLAHDDDLDRQDKQDLIDRIEKLEKALEQKTKEVETLKSENQALLRVVNQVSSLHIQ